MRQHYRSTKNYNHIGPKTDSSPTIIDDKPWIRLFAADWYGMIPDKRYYLNFYIDVVFFIKSVKTIQLNDMREQFNIYFIWVQSKLIVQFQEQFPHTDEPLSTWKLWLGQATLVGLLSKSGGDMITHKWIVLQANSPGNIGIARHRFCRSYGEVDEIVDHLLCSCLTVSKGSLKTLESAYLLKFIDLMCNI